MLLRYICCRYANGLQIQDTSIEELGLVSLKSIKFGKIAIALNKNLCYVDSVNWASLLTDPERQKIIIVANKNESSCRKCSS